MPALIVVLLGVAMGLTGLALGFWSVSIRQRGSR